MNNKSDKLVLMSDNLAAWLNREMMQRGWSLRQIAKRAGISHTTIVKLANGIGHPEIKTCRALAQAMSVPVEDVLRLAGILPTGQLIIREAAVTYNTHNEADNETRLLQLWRVLSPADRALLLDIAARLAEAPPRIIG